jgi:hypothetical protein
MVGISVTWSTFVHRGAQLDDLEREVLSLSLLYVTQAAFAVSRALISRIGRACHD